ncbi:E3 ubiquitin ligase [Aquimarina sp. MAR_2010_214]|uniref:GIDE domain-containing protein n=1 Tax=Aquimarina sp. MAR_2010_214 TaxID=1250026 RepID=UPI000C7068A1|nr:GIDE domain-containing protein [Aquimarina sp. MAR_2010_214]PKV49416.1 E3 ubiquitin ligase [Aquimarina sp. MAR_2010_214]
MLFPFLSFDIDTSDVLFFVLIGGMILYGVLKKKKPSTIETLEVSKISESPNGLCKIKGRILAIDKIGSPITETKCIGYSYSQLSYRYGGIRRAKGRKKWRTYRTESKSTDFYIEDSTGKIKVNARGISIQINVNRTEKKLSRTLLDVENLLLEDGTEYILTGTVIKNKDGSLEIIKNEKDKELVIMDKALYEFVYEDIPFMKKKASFFILFLVICVLCFIIYKSISN